ncbi:MAG: RNA polymerase sigma factor [Gammaproteobacteria bacterium]
MSHYPADRDLVSALLRGERLAFDRFFADYFPRLFRFVLPRVEHNPAAAEDMCQHVLSRAIRSLAGYRGEAALFTWVCQIARNELSRYWERHKYETANVLHIEDDDDVRAMLEAVAAPESEQPESQRLRSEVTRLMHVALDHLPQHYANALEMKYIDGLSVQEVADRLAQSVTATQSVLARARTALRSLLESVGVTTPDELATAIPKLHKGYVP